MRSRKASTLIKQQALSASGLRAFTLIELLVVISIIVLLIALLLPALSAARETSKKVMCASNIHQLVLSMTNYSVDEEGAYPVIPAVDAAEHHLLAELVQLWHREPG